MGKRIVGISGLLRGGPALVVALAVTVATLAGAGQAAAAAHPGEPRVPGGQQPGAAGVISTVAGGVGGPGRATRVGMFPCGVAFGGGHVYIGTESAVREVNPGSDWLTTPAGTGTGGPVGDGGRATKASVSEACGVGVDGSGNLLIADADLHRIQVVAASTGTFYGRAMLAGHIYPVAGTGQAGFSGDGGPATSAKLYGPSGVAVDGAGNLVIADPQDLRIRVVAASTGTFYGQAMTAGDIYTVAGTGRYGFSGDGGPGTRAAIALVFPSGGVAVDGAGNLIIADTGNDRVRVVAASTGTFYGQAMTAGDIYTVAGNGTSGFSGDGGAATSAEIASPASVAVDGAGNLVVADSENERVRVVAASTGSFYGQAMTTGDIYTVAGTGMSGSSGDGGPATSAELTIPSGVAVDGAGNLVIADTANNRVQVVAASTGNFYGQAMTAGDVYTVPAPPVTGVGLFRPAGVAVDGAGNLLIADTANNLIREVTG